jgi:hypothetical protein
MLYEHVTKLKFFTQRWHRCWNGTTEGWWPEHSPPHASHCVLSFPLKVLILEVHPDLLLQVARMAQLSMQDPQIVLN